MRQIFGMLGLFLPPVRPGWRSAAEELPPAGMFVLVCEGGRWEVRVVDDGGLWLDQSGEDLLDRAPVRWHLLPEPPPPPIEGEELERAEALRETLREAFAGLFDDGWRPSSEYPADGVAVLFILSDLSKAVLLRREGAWVDQDGLGVAQIWTDADGRPVGEEILHLWHVLPEPPPAEEETSNVVPLRQRTP